MQYMFRKNHNPYSSGADFNYRPQWTGRYYSLLRQVIKSIMLDPRQEMQSAWQAVLNAGGPEKVPEAMKYFNKLPFEYQDAAAAAKSLRGGSGESASQVAGILRKWSEDAAENYRMAEKLAREGR